MAFHRIVAGALAFTLGFAPLSAMADVYINVGSPGMFIWQLAKAGCEPSGQGAKCNDTATGNGGAGVTFVASEPNGQCIGSNPRQLPCITYTFCFVKIARQTSGHYDLVAVKTDVGEPSYTTAGAIMVGSHYKRTRKDCVASWTNNNTLTLSADLLTPDRPAVKGVITCDATPGFQTWSKPPLYPQMPTLPKGTSMTFYPPAFNGRLFAGFIWVNESCVKLAT